MVVGAVWKGEPVGAGIPGHERPNEGNSGTAGSTEFAIGSGCGSVCSANGGAWALDDVMSEETCWAANEYGIDGCGGAC